MAQAGRKHSSGYYHDVEDWNGSKAVQRMTFSERGVYQAMLDEQWERRFLPDDPEEVADRIAINDGQRDEVIAAWPKVRVKFVTAERGPHRIYNAKLERVRRQQRDNLRSKQHAGRTAGLASARKRKEQHELPVNDRSTTVQRPSTDLTRSDSDLTRPDLTRSDSEPTARSKRPIFTGQRLTVFEWMLDNCTKTLGPLTDDFDLHTWFGDLDGLVARTNMVIPQRDGGAWLNARLLEECRKRGLPIASSTPTEGSKRVAGLMAGGEAFLKRSGATS